jgi:hypothetical protein
VVLRWLSGQPRREAGSEKRSGGVPVIRLLQESAQAEKEITSKLYADYKAWRINLLISLIQSSGKPAEELIEPVQKLLDRVLFIAFAEDRGLLPAKTLSQAFSHRDLYNPRPIWENFLGLFRAIDKGNQQLGINWISRLSTMR